MRENLLLGMKSSRATGRWSFDDVLTMFPMLRARIDAPGGVLSGGEQQMWTICRKLRGDPDLIMVDEPPEGLAPRLVEQVRRLLDQIAARGVAILLIEQKLTIALAISHRLRDGAGTNRVRRRRGSAPRQSRGAQEWLEV